MVSFTLNQIVSLSTALQVADIHQASTWKLHVETPMFPHFFVPGQAAILRSATSASQPGGASDRTRRRLKPRWMDISEACR